MSQRPARSHSPLMLLALAIAAGTTAPTAIAAEPNQAFAEPILVTPSPAALAAELEDMARIAAQTQAQTQAQALARAASAQLAASAAASAAATSNSTSTTTSTTTTSAMPTGESNGVLGETISRMLPSLRARARTPAAASGSGSASGLEAGLSAGSSAPAALAPPSVGAISIPLDAGATSSSSSGNVSASQQRAWARLRQHPDMLTAGPSRSSSGGPEHADATGRASHVKFPPEPQLQAELGSGTAAVDGADPASADPWLALSRPGAMHALLGTLEGTWDVRAEFDLGDGRGTDVVTGTMVNTWTLGRRWLQQSYAGASPALGRFDGQGTLGFDNALGRFVGSWVDSLSTTMMHTTGTYDGATMGITLAGPFAGPENSTFTQRQVLNVISPSRYTVTMFLITPQGREVRTGQAEYRRRSGAITYTNPQGE